LASQCSAHNRESLRIFPAAAGAAAAAAAAATTTTTSKIEIDCITGANVAGYLMGPNLAAGLSAVKILLESTADWDSRNLKLRWMQVKEFKTMIDNNTVLGFQKNLQLPKYARTPIIEAMGTADHDLAAVSVAMVPASRGKTTAAYYVLRKKQRTHTRDFHLPP
jgi:hypothetical protein